MTEQRPEGKKKSILVTGDVIIDHHIYKGNREAPHLNVPGTTIAESLGGAELLYEIISKAVESGQPGCEVSLGLNTDPAKTLPLNHHSYAVWNPCPKDKDSNDKVWRMTEPMGYGVSATTGDICQTLPPIQDKTTPDILVIDDGALGYRFCKHDVWPNFLNAESSENLKWIVLKTCSPVAQGDLWRALSSKFMDKLVVVVAIRDIRREEAGITQGLSWERTALDLMGELKFNSSINDLLKCRHLIVSFGSEGALWIDKDTSGIKYRLVYDPAHLEGEWYRDYKGRVFGHMSCLTAGIVNRLAGKETDIGNGIKAGLSTMRVLHEEGHGDANIEKPGFPIAEVAKSIISPKYAYSIVDAPNPPDKIDSDPVHWEIIEGISTVSNRSSKPLYGKARRVAMFGTKALSNIPYVSFKKLFTVDKSEMESLRGIEHLVKNYVANKEAPRPLSIAVFGPPGSGKSFGIKQIAESILGKDSSILEFNLSQFEEKPEALIGPLHQVRDEALSGKMPVVFWDEFDSRENYWLQYLLAPMQDGKFREGLMSHPIGKCVFVFAGGTSRTMDNFTPEKQDVDAYRKFKLKKGPDFVSRLAGYLNVLGPNKRKKFDKDKKEWIDDTTHVDICFPVRRALLLRNMFGLGKDDELHIDKGLLNAFLEIEEYKHGARSLETIALLTKGSKANGLMRSDLPPEEQMAIHVDYKSFMNIIKRDLPFKMHAEDLAPYIHKFYCKSDKKGKSKSKYGKVSFANLSPDIKADNIAAATRLPEVLYLAGLKIVPKNHPESLTQSEIKASIEEGIEILAEEEHDGWLDFKKLNGWVLGERDDAKKIHNLLKPYNELAETEKNKDGDAVRHYPKIVDMAGYKICGIK